MPSVFDVAKYIVQKRGTMTSMKLQKLVYYAQAWSLVWDEAPVFSEKIEAWANGPVVPPLFKALQGLYNVNTRSIHLGNPNALTPEQMDTIDRVLEFYGTKSPQWLSDLTHIEDPWRNARVGLAPNARSNREITHAAMADYYSSL